MDNQEELDFYKKENDRLTKLVAKVVTGKANSPATNVELDSAVELKKQVETLTEELTGMRADFEIWRQRCDEATTALAKETELCAAQRGYANELADSLAEEREKQSVTQRALDNEMCNLRRLVDRVIDLEKALAVETQEHQFWKTTAEAELKVSLEFQEKYEDLQKTQVSEGAFLKGLANQELKISSEFSGLSTKLRSAQEEIIVLRASNVSQGEGYAKLWNERDEARTQLAEAQVLIRSLQAAQVSQESPKNGSSSPENPKSEATPTLAYKPGDKVIRAKGKKKEELLIERIDGKQILCSVIGKPNSSHWLHQDVISALLTK